MTNDQSMIVKSRREKVLFEWITEVDGKSILPKKDHLNPLFLWKINCFPDNKISR